MRLKLLVLCTGGALLSGCMAIPCGTTTFTTEYPTDIRAADEKPEREYEPSVAATPGEDGKVDIGLFCEITTTQPREQHYNSVSLTKSRRIAIGVFPDFANDIYRSKGALEQTRDTYIGNGRYSESGNDPENTKNKHGKEFGWNCGRALTSMSLGLLGTPFACIWGVFGPFEHDWHYMGPVLERKSEPGVGLVYIRDSKPIDLLLKFSPEDRERIGAWTWHEDDRHPQNTFWHSFTMLQWAGVGKYCIYVVHDPVEMEKTTPVEPTVTRDRKAVTGPYGVFLRIPDVDFTRTLVVPRGETAVEFDLTDLIGKTTGEAYVRFLPPSGGMEEAWDDDARILLEQVQGRDFAVGLDMPLLRLSGGNR